MPVFDRDEATDEFTRWLEVVEPVVCRSFNAFMRSGGITAHHFAGTVSVFMFCGIENARAIAAISHGLYIVYVVVVGACSETIGVCHVISWSSLTVRAVVAVLSCALVCHTLAQRPFPVFLRRLLTVYVLEPRAAIRAPFSPGRRSARCRVRTRCRLLEERRRRGPP